MSDERIRQALENRIDALEQARQHQAKVIERLRRKVLLEAASTVEEFSWVLPVTDDLRVNEATDDAACSVLEQAAAHLRRLAEEATS